MKKFNWKSMLPHAVAIAIFAIVAIIYCKPAFDGKVLQQSDTTQWKAMAQSSFKYKEQHGHFPLWINSMFCGMPAYQIAMDNGDGKFDFVSLGPISTLLSLGLPKPASFFFLACICFYFLALIMRCNPYVSIGTALSYAYCTYNPVIIVAGHETKMWAIAYMPALIGSVLLLFQKKYILGTATTALFAALLISANHLQITYYTAIIIAFMSVAFLISCIKEKQFKHLFIAAGLAIFGALLGIGSNTMTLATTSEYGKLSIRGGSILAGADTTVKGNVTKTGLNKDYAFSYSIYKTEPLAMMIPRAYGGSASMEVDEEKSKAVEKLREMPQQMAQQLQGYLGSYWGGIGATAGPPYIGAIICLLALMGFVVLDDKYKWWILGATIFTLMLSWGKYFDGFNTFMLNNLPAYNKFRAPSMILVVPTLLLTMMAALSLNTIVSAEDKEAIWDKYKKGLMVVGGMLVLAILFYLGADFAGEGDKALLKQVSEIQDAQQKASVYDTVKAYVNAIRDDRKGLFLSDLFRTILFMAAAAIALWLSIKNKISAFIAVAIVSVLAFIDVITIDLKYFNNDKFQDAAEYADASFKQNAFETELLKDKSNYRVFNVTNGTHDAFNGDARTSYYVNSIGGYHPAKLSIYQDLVERQLYNFPNCLPVINMLNTKYIIQQNPQNGQPTAYPNPAALGNCWFVNTVTFKKTPLEVMNTLTTLNTKDSAVVEEASKDLVKYDNVNDSTATISLVKNDNDIVEYASKSATARFAVFSEIYYNAGWKAYIDGKEATIVKTNYVLRGLSVPAGEHKIKFEFKPNSYYNSLKIGFASSALIWILLFVSGFLLYKQSRK
ncbi:MAG: YfhO family protein [Chitinophagaceae bacterium]